MSTTLKGKKIAVLMGGPGSEREVSLRSAENVAKGLRSCGAEVFEVDVRDEHFVLPVGTELAYLMIHGTYGEDGGLQSELEKRGIPYTGEGAQQSRVAFDKILSKKAFEAGEVSTPRWEVIAPGQSPTLPLPVVIKAPQQGSSVGVYLCRTQAELEKALASVVSFGQEILVEELISGVELTAGIVGDRVLPLIMISGIYDYARKYPWSAAAQQAKSANPQQEEAQHTCPAPLSPAHTELVQALALKAHKALGLQVYSRVDVLLDPSKEAAYVLEANTIPGMTESSLLPEAAREAGIGLDELLTRIADLSGNARGLASCH